MTRNVLTIGGFAAVLLLSGCGSDSTSSTAPGPGSTTPPPTTTPAEGVQGAWRGSINTPTPSARLLETIVLDDGSLWMAYSTANDPTQTDALLNAAGLIKGSGTPDLVANTFNVTTAKELSIEDGQRVGVDVNMSFVTGSSLTGTITRDAGPGTSALPSPADFSSLYRTAYNNNYTLQHLAGTYQGSLTTGLGKHSASITIDSAGAITGSESTGCTVTGTATARTRGNVFNVALTWGNEPGCGANAANALDGVVSLESGRIGMMATDSDVKKAFIFVGNR